MADDPKVPSFWWEDIRQWERSDGLIRVTLKDGSVVTISTEEFDVIRAAEVVLNGRKIVKNG